MRRWLRAAAIIAALAPAASAEERTMDAATLAHGLDRLASTGRVLYVAAHPDDENTRLLAHLANQRHVTAAYLSMTRGGGGQNLIGPEQEELLDVIRTQELLAARRLDGARQLFTRMRDFGFSKTAEETLAFWGEEEALADVVWVIRVFQPDVIVARFDEQPPNHGHHTASAILARRAFAAAADPARFPEQLALGVEPWQAERLLLNLSPWREEPSPEDALPLDVGGYDARLGVGYGELAARSRSQHKSQGFGVAGERGELFERFVVVAGSRPDGDLLAGVDLTWRRFGRAGAKLADAFEAAQRSLERDHPERALPPLLEAHRLLEALPPEPRVREARVELDRLIAAAAGLFARVTADRPGTVPGGSVPLALELVLRRPAAARLVRVEWPGLPPRTEEVPLAENRKVEVKATVTVAADAPVSAPYWLAEPPLAGRQQVAAPALVGAPEGPPALGAAVGVRIGARTIRLELPVVYAWNDPVHGERLRDFLVVPPATVSPVRRAVMFSGGAPAPVAVRVRAAAGDVRGAVALELPAGWRAQPERHEVALARAGDEISLRFDVTPPAGAAPVEARPVLESGGRRWSYREDVIDYPHIPLQVVLRPAEVRLVPLELARPEGRIGYVPGSGDTIADDLAHVGFAVDFIDDDTLLAGDLGRWRAIAVGIRAYNTSPALRAAHERLMRWVEDGGTLVVQYVTNSRIAPLESPIGPYPFVVGRERVTEETAAMEILAADDAALLRPNRIGAADFDGWVQERGLYFAESWDPRYRPLLRAADTGEAPLDGAVLVARHGKGRYVYTGLSFFRQLPAGVPGAYRLLANLLAGE